jgi:hypothetical protein
MIKIVTIEPTLVFSTNGCSFPWRGSKCQKAATLTATRIIPRVIESIVARPVWSERSFMPDQGIDHEKFFGLAVKIR